MVALLFVCLLAQAPGPQELLDRLNPPTVKELTAALAPIPGVNVLLASDVRSRPDLSAEQMKSYRVLVRRREESRRRNEVDEAEDAAVALVELCEEALGEEHWRTQRTQHALDEVWDVASLSDENGARLVELTAMSAEISSLMREGRYSEAATLATGQVAGLMEILPGDYEVTIRLKQLARALAGMNDTSSLLACRRAIVFSALERFGESTFVVAELKALGRSLDLAARGSESGPLYRKVLQIELAAYGSEHERTADALNFVAMSIYGRGDHRRAAPLLERVLEIYRSRLGSMNTRVAKCLANLSGARQNLGELEQAEELLREALEIYREVGTRRADSLIAMTSNLGTVLQDQGRFEEARSALREGLDLSLELHGEKHRITASRLSTYGWFLVLVGDYQEAEECIRRGLATQLEILGESHPETAASLNNMGGLMLSKGEYERALELSRKSVELHRKLLPAGHPTLQRTVSNLAAVLHRTGGESEAEGLVRGTIETLRRSGLAKHAETARAKHNLGWVLAGRGDEQAVEVFREALALRLELFGPDNPDVALTKSGLATSLLKRGSIDEAEQLVRDSLAIGRAVRGPRSLVISGDLLLLSDVLEARGDLPGAERALRECLGILESRRSSLIGAERERALFAARLKHAHVTRRLSRILIELGQLEGAFSVSEQGRGRVLLDLLARSDRALVDDLERSTPKAGAKLRALIDLESQARERMTGAEESLLRGRGSRAELDRSRVSLHAAEIAVLTALRGVWPDAEPADPAAIRASLEEGELMLSYSWSGEAATLLLVPPAGEEPIEAFHLASGVESVERLALLVSQVKGELATARSRRDGQAHLRAVCELSQQLLPEAVRARILAARRVVILPDGPLGALPFEVLTARSPCELESSLILIGPDLVYAASATVYVNRCRSERVRSDQAPTALLLGDPVFDSSVPHGAPLAALSTAHGSSRLELLRQYDGLLAALPGSRREVESIASVFRDVGGEAKVLLGEESTIPLLEDHVTGKHFVHLATHGLAGTPERPFDASLALTRPEELRSTDPGFLTLDRLLRSWRGRLAGSELVVLSACETQVGARVGDTVMALPWGFYYAGAPTVLASLWKVDDRATALLMTRFYENLLGAFDDERTVAGGVYRAGQSMRKSTALHEAKSWLRSATRKDVRGRARGDRSRGLEAEPDPLGPTTVDSARLVPYSDPYFWAAFILLGDPE